MSTFKKEGIIAATLSLDGKRNLSSYKLRYVQIESGAKKYKFSEMTLEDKKTDFLYNPGEVEFGYSNGDFEEGDKDVYLFNIVQQAGKYRIFELEVFHNSGSQLHQYHHKVPIDITFEIEEGKIKYLGEINITIKQKDVKLIDKIERDRKKFREKNPRIIF